jgi:hypothetical protein
VNALSGGAIGTGTVVDYGAWVFGHERGRVRGPSFKPTRPPMRQSGWPLVGKGPLNAQRAPAASASAPWGPMSPGTALSKLDALDR